MDDRPTELRRRIERYRSYLREGLSASFATIYLKQIADDEAELKRIAAKRPDQT
jgi:hypothetical protein